MQNKFKYLSSSIIALLFSLSAAPAYALSTSPRPSLDEPVKLSDFTGFFKQFKQIGVIICGICALTSLVFFIISVTKLSMSAGNDRGRAMALRGILFSGIALALFGGASVLIGIFWNAI